MSKLFNKRPHRRLLHSSPVSVFPTNIHRQTTLRATRRHLSQWATSICTAGMRCDFHSMLDDWQTSRFWYSNWYHDRLRELWMCGFFTTELVTYRLMKFLNIFFYSSLMSVKVKSLCTIYLKQINKRKTMAMQLYVMNLQQNRRLP